MRSGPPKLREWSPGAIRQAETEAGVAPCTSIELRSSRI